YADQLRQWAIFQHPPGGGKAICVYRFRTRSDADAYMSILRQGGGKFEVLFDPVVEEVVTPAPLK
ncbi:MAG: hypothetical protein ACYT04_40080, partial [Nostoc sp.]